MSSPFVVYYGCTKCDSPNKKPMRRLIAFLAVAVLSLPFVSFAQESPQEGTVLADVNLSNATIVQNDGTTVRVSSAQQASDRSALPPNINDIMREQMLRDERFQGLTEEQKEEAFRSMLGAVKNAEQVDPIGDKPCSESLVTNADKDTRIPYLALSGYPLHELGDGAVSTLSACVRNTDTSVAKDVSLTLTLADGNGKEIETVTDTGALVNMAFSTAHDFSFENRSGTLVLTATLTKDGEVLETRTETYDCEGYGFCPMALFTDVLKRNGVFLAVGTFLLVVLILFSVRYKDALKTWFHDIKGNGMKIGIILLFGVLAWGGSATEVSADGCAIFGFYYPTGVTAQEGDCSIMTCSFFTSVFSIKQCSCPSNQFGPGTMSVQDSTTGNWSTYSSECAPITVYSPCGVSACDGKIITLGSDVQNINLRTKYNEAYPSTAPVDGERIIFVINEGVIVGSNNASSPALTVGSWPDGVDLLLVNNGYIAGAGGDGGIGGSDTSGSGSGHLAVWDGHPGSSGGTALYTRYPITIITNDDMIRGGGGGGGGGAGSWADAGQGGGGGGGFVFGEGGLGGDILNIVRWAYPGQRDDLREEKKGGDGSLFAGGRGEVFGLFYGYYGGGNGGAPGEEGGHGYATCSKVGPVGDVPIAREPNPSPSTCYDYAPGGAGGAAGKNVDGLEYVTWSDGVVNGVCGTADGVAVPSIPTANLCSSGTASPVPVAGTGPWSWTCLGPDPVSSADDASCSAPKAPTLRLCQNGIYYARGGETGIPVALNQGDERNLTAIYGPGTDCTTVTGDIDVTSSITDTASDVVTLLGSNPKILHGNNVPNASNPGQQTASENVTATYSGQTVTMPVTVLENCVSGCATEAGSHCKGESFTADDSCGVSETCSNAGTRSCEFNWKEVIPGF